MTLFFRISAVVPTLAFSAACAIAADTTASPSPTEFVHVEGRTVVLDNGVVRRVVSLSPGGEITTASFRLAELAGEFVTSESAPEDRPAADSLPDLPRALRVRGPNSLELGFVANGESYSGKSSWELVGIDANVRDGEGQGATVRLRATAGRAAPLLVEVTYVLYPHLPVIRKRLRFVNESTAPVTLESVDVEQLNLSWHPIENTVYKSYGRQPHVGPFTGTADDGVVVAHSGLAGRGMVVATEAPGVMKRITAFADGRSVTAGLTHAADNYPFRTWIAAGGSWVSTWTFVAPYAGEDASAPLATVVPDFVRRHLGVRLAKTASRPTFVYNTWAPFRTEINARLIGELADAAGACGIKEFVIDDGWAESYGDWRVDRKKFPDGLKPVFDRIKSLGMKPGLWLSLASVSRDSQVFHEHPEWFVHNAADQPTDLHAATDKYATACLSTGWKDYMRDVILGLVREHGLQYVKLDLAIVTSAYVFDYNLTGCAAKNHPHHDRAESFLMNYQRAWELFDELHAAAPDLFIDCTFETMGAAQLIDLDMCKHAEGNWLSNFYDDPPDGSLRVRQMGWWRSGTVPAGALVIGNQRIDAKNSLLSYQSLTGTLPIVLGDPRKLNDAERAAYRQWADWFQAAENRDSIMLFRQDLPGLGEPNENGWDGFARINTETRSGGIVGVFRNESAETARAIFVPGLDPDRLYVVQHAPTGETVARLTGAALRLSGFPVHLNQPHSAALFQVVAASGKAEAEPRRN